jgi:arginine exporter protein ArgO
VTFTTIFLLFAIALLAQAIADAVRFIRKERKQVRTRKELLLAVGSIAASINFFAFVVVAILIGGDALSGKVEAGRYFLGQHGTYTQVSRGVFLYSAFHATLALLGILAVAGAGLRRRPD